MGQNRAKRMASLLHRAREISKERGFGHVIRAGISEIIRKTGIGKIANTFWLNYYKKYKSKRSFVFQGKSYRYFYHEYNTTFNNERCVEIPIIWDYVKENKGKRILEVGNVLSHYFPIDHDVVDKYERAEGVINQDIVDFSPGKRYDLIVSISTLEHVGWDEDEKEPKKILKAVKHLKELLSPGGKMVVTLPIGYNPVMDRLLEEGILRFDKTYFLKRITRDNEWVETDWDGVRNARYGRPFPNANGLVIGIIERK